MIVAAQLVHQPGPRPTVLELSDALRAVFDEVHGTSATFEVPGDYATFLRETGGWFQTLDRDGALDPYGWRVFGWETVLDATLGGYDLFVHSEYAPEWEIADSIKNLREAGLWLNVGGRDRHEHFLCCDRSKAEFGQVYDLHDGHPATGMTYDRAYRSFAEYIA